MRSQNDNDDAERELLADHVPSSACILFENAIDPSKSRLWSRASDSVVVEVLEELLEMQKEMARDIRINHEMIMTEQDRRDHASATCCYLCREGFKTVPKTN